MKNVKEVGLESRRHIQAIQTRLQQILLQTEEYSMENTKKSQLGYITADIDFLQIQYILMQFHLLLHHLLQQDTCKAKRVWAWSWLPMAMAVTSSNQLFLFVETGCD